MFVVGHVDYVRTVSLRPVGPEQTELTAEWLFAPDALASDAFDLDNIVSFGVQVLEEDAAVCEINQRGLHSARHEAGVLMPEEYDIHRFHGGYASSMSMANGEWGLHRPMQGNPLCLLTITIHCSHIYFGR